MKKTVPLKENYLFRRLYQRGKTAADGRIALYVRRNGGRENRLGFTVSTKVGCAVVRNRVRRRLREIYRLHEMQFRPGYDLVVVARSQAVNASFSQLTKAYLSLADKLNLRNEAGQ